MESTKVVRVLKTDCLSSSEKKNEVYIVSIEKLSNKGLKCFRFCVAAGEIKDFTCDSESKVAANISLGKRTRKLQ